MTSFSQFRKKINESIGIVDTFICYGKKVTINENFSVNVDGDELSVEFNSLDEAKLYVTDYIRDTLEVESLDTAVIPEAYLASLISKHHNINRITDTLIETYTELASSNSFSADPVILEMKMSRTGISHNKLEWILEDGSTVAVDSSTQERLNRLLEDKQEVVDHMRENKDNFINIVREVI